MRTRFLITDRVQDRSTFFSNLINKEDLKDQIFCFQNNVYGVILKSSENDEVSYFQSGFNNTDVFDEPLQVMDLVSSKEFLERINQVNFL